MLKNYLLSAFRNILKQKAYSFINISGLAIGLTCCILITLYITDELNYDSFHEDADNIYRVALIGPEGGVTRTPHPIAQALVTDFPEVENAVTVSPIWGPGLTWAEMTVQYKENRFFEKRFFSADTTFFEVFTFPSVLGDADKAMREPGAIIITESIANKYFGKEDPLSKVIRLNDQFDLMVRAVIKDIPDNSHFHFDFLISYVTLKPMETSNYYTWADFGHYNYIVLKKGIDPQVVESKIPEWSKKYIDYSIPDLKSDTDISKYLKLQSLMDIHLKSHLRWELGANGNISYIYIFSAAAFLILLIACINFMNLATARSINRAKEVGIRKAIGANRNQLLVQFFIESFMLTTISTVIALVLIEIVLPYFNSFTNKNLSLSIAGNPYHFAGIILITILVGFLSGGYPALFLSSFNPVKVLKGKFSSGGAPVMVRKGLITFQFSISIFLILATIVIYNQLHYMNEKELGFDKDQVIIIPLKENDIRDKCEAFKNVLRQNQYISSVAGASNVPFSQFNQESIRWKPEDNPVSVSEMWVDSEFFRTLDIKISDGRNFSREFGMDTVDVFIINESTVKQFKWNNAVGEDLYYYPQDRVIKGRVVGVVKDFHYKPLQESIQPLLIQYREGNFNNLLIRLKAGQIQQGIEEVKKTWNNFSSNSDLEFSFLDEYLSKSYSGVNQMGNLFNIFSLLSVIIACLGLYGLAAYSAEQRTREIGIRKSLGATTTGIFLLLSKDFSKWILIANIIAWPVGYLIMENWLTDFAYRINMNLIMFIVAALAAFLISFFTVSYQSFKAANANPIDSLKYE